MAKPMSKEALDRLYDDLPGSSVHSRSKVVIPKPHIVRPKPSVQGLQNLDLDSLSRKELLGLLDMLEEEYDEIEECRLFLYKPNHEVALEAHLCTSTIQIVGGGNRSGKTTTMIIDRMIMLTGIVPRALEKIYPQEKLFHPQHGRIVSTDFPNGIDKVIVPMFLGPRSWFPQSMILNWDPKNRTMTLRNKYGSVSTVEFMSYEQDVEKFQGTSRHWVLYDEEPPQAIRNECKMRVMDVNGQEVFSMTPTKGISWTFDELYEKRGREVAYDPETDPPQGDINDYTILVGEPDTDLSIPSGDPDIHFFNFFSIHNPNIDRERMKKEAAKMGKDERAMRIFGQYIALTGRVFEEYDEKIHLVKSPFDIPEDWPRYMALDPHPRTPHAVMWIAVDSMGRKWAYDELWAQDGSGTALPVQLLAYNMLKKEYYQIGEDNQSESFPEPDELFMKNPQGLWVLKKAITFKRPWVVQRLIDPSANIESPQTSTSIVTDLARLGVGFFINGSKDLSRGILKVKDVLKTPELFIFPHLARTRMEFRKYVWDSWANRSEMSKDPKQKPKDKDDHMMENLRRIITEDPKFITKQMFSEDLGSWRRH